MKTDRMLTAKVLQVEVEPLNQEPTKKGNYTFKALQFENGLILVPGVTTHDWFFENVESIQACGTDRITDVKETGDIDKWTSSTLLSAIQDSVKEFGVDSIPRKHFELWK